MRILFAGTPTAAVPSLRALVESNHEVVAVLTRPDAPRGRGRKLMPSPVALAAHEAGIPVLTPTSLRSDEVQDSLASLGVDAAAVVAYGALIPRQLLDAFPWINLHFSLLPRWRGAAPVQRAIAEGDEITGVTTFLLEEGLDTGPVFETLEHPLTGSETSGEVLETLAHAGSGLLVSSLTLLAEGFVPVPQPPDGVTLAPKVDVAEAQIDWGLPTDVIERRIRAYTPNPGAWTITNEGLRIKVGPLQSPGADATGLNDRGEELPEARSQSLLPPGGLRMEKNAVAVGTGDGEVRLGSVAPSGKGWMPAAAWARGVRTEIGFESV